MQKEDPAAEVPEPFRGPATWSLDLRTGEMHSSPARARLMGYDPQSVVPSSQWWDRALHPDERLAVYTARSRHLQGTDSGYRSEYRVQRQDGEWMWLLEIGCIERDNAGSAISVHGVLLDITVDREAQFRTQQRLERLSTIFDYIYQLTGLLSPAGVVLEINRSALRAAEASRAEALGMPLWETVLWQHQSAGETERLRDGIRRASRGEFVRFQMQADHPQGGQKRIIDFSLLPVLDDEGAVTSILSEGRDVTDIVTAQAAVRNMEDRLAIAASTANLGLWDVDLRTGEGWHNDYCWTMLGYEPHEVATGIQQWLSMIHPDDLAQTILLMQDQRDTGGDFRAEYRMRAKDGSWRWIHCFGRTVANPDPNAPKRMAGVHLDVTERREAEIRSHAAERLESVGKLAAGVAHEINTPVQFVSDSIYFVRDGLYELLALTDRLRMLASRDQCNANSVAALSTHLPYLVENLPKALERSLDGLKRVSEIVSSMRELAHPDRPEMSDIDVNHVIQNAMVVARSEYKYVAEIETELTPLPPVRGHAGELNQVILNLLVNASHAISDVVGESQQKGLIRITTQLDGDSVLISVSDTGSGIPANIQHRIFEPFFTTKDVGRGTGQGLAISHNIIVKRHGGSIEFDSTVGQATVFRVRLPYDRKAAEQVA
ncbi:MAG TPA: PAS domain-containing protein [Steroidobacteraceae bacterium]|jgi:two-component system NtrC family sensor kinase|nr:PAS domain-containing protein [Steroidobacteraceae bacterium]